MTYAWEKFHLAIRTLAGPGTISQRMAEAFTLHLLHVEPGELPEEVRPLFLTLRDRLTRVAPVGDQSLAEAAVATLSEQEALECIDQLMVMIDAVARREGNF